VAKNLYCRPMSCSKTMFHIFSSNSSKQCWILIFFWLKCFAESRQSKDPTLFSDSAYGTKHPVVCYAGSSLRHAVFLTGHRGAAGRGLSIYPISE